MGLTEDISLATTEAEIQCNDIIKIVRENKNFTLKLLFKGKLK